MSDWKETLNLPRTSFPMKANLQVSEPEAIRRWEETRLYAQLRAARTGAAKFILHDGPPYANGRIHIGTAFNKILKDFTVRTRSMEGFDAPYVPGWDCHGLPIELKVDRELGSRKRELTTAEFRRECRKYAEKYVDIMREDFRRLGVMGDWAAPYLTMDFAYQAGITRALGRFVSQELVYKGKKPVHWCIHCRTALAEAEVEYEPHSSPSIYVEFPLSEDSHRELVQRLPDLEGRAASVLIWTTTPWTIPSNLAVAFHPDYEYGAYETVDRGVVLMATGLVDAVRAATGHPIGVAVATAKGRDLEGLRFRHPLYARDSVAVLGDYVTLEQGTGVVHTAPGHGADDFRTGVRYGLDIYAPVNGSGHFTSDVEQFAGQRVFDANPRIEEALAANGRLWHRSTVSHSYPHCWRCHNPVIFLATSQWFIAMDEADLRNRALAAVRKVKWLPAWGEERIRGMLASRPDWCISRQRAWGVPIPAMDCDACGTAVLTPELVEQAATVFEQYGADAWYERPLEDFVPNGLSCPACGGSSFTREQDVLDVWFDSGSSHEAVLPVRPELRWPADVYLEGTDQYRGWFQSSLLVGIGTRGAAPYREVITHGFVVDDQGKKMSKSLGTGMEPQEVTAKSGAEILRLWAAMVDYRDEVRISREILARVIEAYRKIRNTCRILLANLYDFNPAEDLVPAARLKDVDRYALARFSEAASKVLRAYEVYDFPTVSQTLTMLVTVDLSAFYVDVSKDRLYTFAPDAVERRSAQTVMYRMIDGLTRMLAPLLPVTTDELWRSMPGPRDASVHLATFPEHVEADIDREVLARWALLLEVRHAVNGEIERLRQRKEVGTSLEAQVTLSAAGAPAVALASQSADDLCMLFIVSRVECSTDETLVAADDDEHHEDEHHDDDHDHDHQTAAESGVHRIAGGVVRIEVARAGGTKCPRCWRYVSTLTSVGPGPTPPDEARGAVCERCADALSAGLSAAAASGV